MSDPKAKENLEQNFVIQLHVTWCETKVMLVVKESNEGEYCFV